ncbi:MAG: hypothetical protein LBF75_05590 [Treponema sp.]|jgi:hypothetical protein|nr:hypothetical protein [Treponema sp.]
MRKKTLLRLVGLILGLMALTSCATTGENYAELTAQGVDVFAGKNWNAPRRNNMYDRWEFNADGTFHFWHVHHGEALDRGLYHYELKQGILTAVKDGTEEHGTYTYTFSGKTVTLTPVEQEEQGGTEHAASGGHQMGALPEATVTFTHAR